MRIYLICLQVEVAPILVPYFHKLTKSELHAILTGGFATVAGSILAIYISFGVSLDQLFLLGNRPTYSMVLTLYK